MYCQLHCQVLWSINLELGDHGVQMLSCRILKIRTLKKKTKKGKKPEIHVVTGNYWSIPLLKDGNKGKTMDR